MQQFRDSSHDVSCHTESSELLGWCTDDEARVLIRAGRATVQSRRGNRHRIVMVASEDMPLVGRDKQRAIAGYIGAAKYTYREELPSGNLIMLKRALPNGQFVPWPKSA